jgi:hypothetical protein
VLQHPLGFDFSFGKAYALLQLPLGFNLFEKNKKRRKTETDIGNERCAIDFILKCINNDKNSYTVSERE